MICFEKHWYVCDTTILVASGSYHQSLTNGFLKESCILSNYKDQNVLSLIGVCVDGGLVPFVVMPFITNSSLLNFLDNVSEYLCEVPWRVTVEKTVSVYNFVNGLVVSIIIIYR